MKSSNMSQPHIIYKLRKLAIIGIIVGFIFASFTGLARASGEFTEINAGLLDMRGDIAWGDYNNDGFLDLVEVGTTFHAMHPDNIMLYKNNGDGTFSSVADTGLTGVQGYARVKWADFDNDGYLDLIVQGWLSENSPGSTKIYHNNNGNGTFTDTNITLAAVDAGDIALADFNGDGKVDILITGSPNLVASAGITKLYRNDGNNIFTEVSTSLPSFFKAKVVWGDYDNNGKDDLLISGIIPVNGGGLGYTKLYRNDGPGAQPNTWNFTEITIQTNSSTLQYIGTVAWSDYNKDGMLDFAISSNYSDVYRNDGIGTQSNTWKFTAINAGLMSSISNCAWGSSVSWGDYDNDGYSDILMTAESYTPATNYVPQTEIYHNDGPVGPGGQWQFTDINAGLQGVHEGNTVWGDYDNDGDLDIALNGRYDFCGLDTVTKIYRNNLGSNASVVNTIPNAPSGPQANVSGSNVNLSWQKATDAQTPQNGLNYNIFIGTAPNSVDIESPMAQLSNGWRRVSATGSQNENISWTINNLTIGTYYWGVQAIDTAFAGSPFALGTFVVGGGYSISGQVTLTGTSTGLGGVTITADNNGGSTTTAADGTYTLSNVIPGWSGTVTPSKSGYTFNPQNKNYSNLSANQTNQNYTANSNAYTISGSVKENNIGIPGVDIKEGTTVLATTDQDGYYSFSKDYGWTGTVYPDKSGYSFTPQSRSYINLSENKQNQNYVGNLLEYTISGIVKDSSNNGVANVTLKDSNNNQLAVTATNGTYSFTKPYGWSGIVTPYGDNNQYNFSPVNRSYNNLSSNQTNQDYIAILKMFTVSGTVKDNNGNNIPGATVNGQNASGGTYSITVNFGTSITLTPQAPGYTFAPPSANFTNITSNQTQNFVGTIQTFTVSGTVLDNVNNPIPGATINGQSVASGNYSFTVNYGASITLTPQATGYTFAPPSATFTNITSNQTQNFVGTLQTFTVSGIVKDPSNNGVANVTLKDSNNNQLAITAPDGTYSFTKTYGWSGTVTPYGDNNQYNFSPVNRTYANLNANQTNQDYIAILKIFTVLGTFLDNNNNLLPAWANAQVNGVAVSSTGAYSFTVNYGESITLTPTATGYNIAPPSASFTNITQNQTQNFVGTIQTFTVSGTFLDNNSNPLPSWANAQVNGVAVSSTGAYSFTVNYGDNITLTPTATGYNIAPPSASFTNITENKTQNFVGTLQTFTVSGTVKDNNGNNIPGATVNGQSAASGNYSFTVDYGSNITLTPQATGYDFVPIDKTFTNITSNQTQDFVGTLKTFTVSGTVSGLLPGNTYAVTVTANCTNAGGPYQTVTADATNGNYSMTLPYGWEGSLIASSPAYTLIEAPGVTFSSPVTQDQTQDYKASLNEFSVSGNISNLLPGNTYPITITAECTNIGGLYQTVSADATNGSYSMKLPYGWEGVLKATSTAYILTEEPGVTFVSPVTQDEVQDYKAELQIFTIEGNVSNIDSADQPLPDVLLQAKGIVSGQAYTQTAVTDANGYYKLTVPITWSGTVKPSKQGWEFVPASRSYDNVNSNYTGQDYGGKRVPSVTPAIQYTISGTIKNLTGQPISNAAIKDNTGAIIAYTNSQGFYTFTKVKGWSGVITPLKTGYKFTPLNRSYTNIQANQPDQNYAGKQT